MLRRFLASLLAVVAVWAAPVVAADGSAHWDSKNARALADFAAGVERHGLDPAAYDPARLEAAMKEGDAVAVELAAPVLFRKIARELSSGATPVSQRRLWRFASTAPDDAAIDAAMETALENRTVAQTLDAFAPQQADYRKLSVALSGAANDRERTRILRNMERWRWMPRDFGRDYVLVNIPAFEAVIVRDGNVVARRKVIVGARKTPTPQFSATIDAVTLNPTWYVPASIVAESVGVMLEKRPQEAERLGYYRAEGGGARQKPGPDNALGQVKLDMPNPWSVFIHDTPQKGNFDRNRRALSHGCIRIEEAIDVAAEILGGVKSKDELDELVATGSTVSIDLPQPLPVFVVYFTLMSDASGALVAHDDIYDLDKDVLTAGGGRAETAEISSECSGLQPA